MTGSAEPGDAIDVGCEKTHPSSWGLLSCPLSPTNAQYIQGEVELGDNGIHIQAVFYYKNLA
jgi:hypothetical protein